MLCLRVLLVELWSISGRSYFEMIEASSSEDSSHHKINKNSSRKVTKLINIFLCIPLRIVVTTIHFHSSAQRDIHNFSLEAFNTREL